jgi:putative peptidoglycan lipid II flippase
MNKLIKATTMLFLIVILSKAVGFVREAILVSTYGASIVSDVYITSTKIPATLFAIIASALSTTFIPLFCEVDKNKGKEESLKFINNMLNIVLILGIIISITAFIFAKPLIKVFAMDFTGEKMLLAVRFTKIMVFSMIFIGVSNILTCWLQINEKYNIPSLTILPYNILLIVSILISKNGNIEILAIGTLIATMSQIIFQLPSAYKIGFRYRPYINIKDENIKKIIYLLGPVILGVGAGEINNIIDGSLASTLGDGIITVLNSASKLDTLVTSLFITTIVSVMYPVLSKLANNNDDEEFKNIIKRYINVVLIIIVPISVGAIVLSTPIVKLIFERGAFDNQATILTSQALKCYAIGMVGTNITIILNKVFYSKKDTKTPMTTSIISIFINITLSLTLIRYMGHMGLALSASIASITRVIILSIKLKTKIGDYGLKIITKTLIKTTIAATIMGIISNISYNQLIKILYKSFLNETTALLISILIGAITYTIIILKMNIEEIKIILNMMKERKHKCYNT